VVSSRWKNRPRGAFTFASYTLADLFNSRQTRFRAGVAQQHGAPRQVLSDGPAFGLQSRTEPTILVLSGNFSGELR
jgi:hypothetical protein